MLKKRKHKIKRRNTEPSVNHPLVLATPGQAANNGGQEGSGQHPASAGAAFSGGPGSLMSAEDTIPEHPQPPVNLADICDSPTHATAV